MFRQFQFSKIIAERRTGVPAPDERSLHMSAVDQLISFVKTLTPEKAEYIMSRLAESVPFCQTEQTELASSEASLPPDPPGQPLQSQ